MKQHPGTRTEELLQRLRDGNRRFATGTAKRFAADEAPLRRELAQGQSPDAVVLTCSDSRVPPTLVFDQGLGDVFAVRVAGNIVAPAQVGSIEFAVEGLGTRLVIVLGHTACGAVTAALDEVISPSDDLSPNLRDLTNRIRPAVRQALEDVVGRTDERGVALTDDERERVLERAIRLNVKKSVDDLRRQSQILDRLAEAGDLSIVGAEYHLEDGTVELLD